MRGASRQAIVSGRASALDEQRRKHSSYCAVTVAQFVTHRYLSAYSREHDKRPHRKGLELELVLELELLVRYGACGEAVEHRAVESSGPRSETASKEEPPTVLT